MMSLGKVINVKVGLFKRKKKKKKVVVFKVKQVSP